MQIVYDFFAGLGTWNWFLVALGLFLLEVAIPGVHFVWFGAAAAVVGALALAIDVPWSLQLIIFAVISVASVFVLRRYSLAIAGHSDQPNLNVRGAQYVGRIVVVEDEIANGRGRVRVGDTLWWAEGPDVEAGLQVKVVGVNGTALVVEPTQDASTPTS
ncbi:MAG: NfeD family protein [Pseudomonadota bacterium]